MLKIKFYLLISLIFLFSCQKSEIEDIEILDYKKLEKISITAKKNIIQNLYKFSINEPYIDYSLTSPPLDYLNNWLNLNFSFIGNENIFEINIIDASIKKSEIRNEDKKKFVEKTIFFYEINFLLEFILYDDSRSILANSIVEVNRTTTSNKFISIKESENIVNTLIYDSLKDLSIKSK